MSQVHALLVGINDYPPPVGKLGGCLNDVDHFATWLQQNLGGRGLALETLKDAQARRDDVIRQFRDVRRRIRPGDVFVFQYCGHGAQSDSAEAFHAYHPDGKDEGLVLYDSREPGGLDLADKELAVLVADIAQRGAHVALILDACHSGSATRSADDFAGMRSRMTLPTSGRRELASYLDGHFTQRLARGESLRSPPGRHILLAACDRGQEAKESPSDRRGVFSATLTEVLEQSGGQLSYADLFVRCRAAVRKRAQAQDPQFEPLGGFDAWSGFLGAATGTRAWRHSVYFDNTTSRWQIDAGAIHGLSSAPDCAIAVALYDQNDPTQLLGTARATDVGAQQTALALDGDFQPPSDARFRAGITSMPVPPLLVHCSLDAGQSRQIQEALDAAASSASTSTATGTGTAAAGASGITLVNQPTGLRCELYVLDGHLLLCPPEQVGADAPTDTPDPPWASVPYGLVLGTEAAAKLLSTLKTIAQWERLLALRNQNTQITPDSVDLVLEEQLPDGTTFEHTGPSVTLAILTDGTVWGTVNVKLKVRNRSGRDLHVAFLYFTPDFGIECPPEVATPPDVLRAQDTGWVTLLDSSLELDTDEAGRWIARETVDRFKLILSTEAIDGAMLSQSGLREAPLTRALGKRRPRQQDWLTKDLQVRLVPRIDEVGEHGWSSPDRVVSILPHPHLRASLNLAPARSATRGSGEDPPFLATFERQGLSIAGLTASRAAAGAPSVIELSGIDAAAAASLAETPLHIEIHQELAQGESLLTFAWDGQHVIPCGTSEHDGKVTHIRIDHLPAQQSDRRSLLGSLKLYFFKTILKQSDVNRLRWVERQADGRWAHREDGVATRVTAAKRIVLMMHGIIGDTDGMVANIGAMGLDEHFDLLLTYDYENLSTSITETAVQLKQALADAGLRAGDDKHLTLLVHSMGGLVARWFIERESGKDVVDHLVMCGTPNSGSPLGKVESARKVLGVLTGLAANHFPALLPFTVPIMLAINRSRKLTPTLEQMDPASDFMRDLNGSDDPGVPYTVLAGNVDEYKPQAGDHFDRLTTSLGRSFLFDALFTLKANDIAVSVESITKVGGGRSKVPQVTQVACHHLNYFESVAGQQALRAIAW